MLFAGEIAAYFKLNEPDVFRQVEARGDIPRALFENAFPGLWDILMSQGVLPVRTRRLLRASKGYSGILLAAIHSESYKLLSLALLQAMHRPISGAFGEATLMRVVSETIDNGTLIRTESADFAFPSPLPAPVELRTLSPLLPPFSIARELTDAHREIARLTGNSAILPETETPCWRTLSASFHVHSPEEGMKGRVTVESEHPYAGAALRYALLKGFGVGREKGYGTLDIIFRRRNSSCG